MSIIKIIIIWVLTVFLGSFILSSLFHSNKYIIFSEVFQSFSLTSGGLSIPTILILIICNRSYKRRSLRKIPYLIRMTLIHLSCSIITFLVLAIVMGEWSFYIGIIYSAIGMFLWTISILMAGGWKAKTHKGYAGKDLPLAPSLRDKAAQINESS